MVLQDRCKLYDEFESTIWYKELKTHFQSKQVAVNGVEIKKRRLATKLICSLWKEFYPEDYMSVKIRSLCHVIRNRFTANSQNKSYDRYSQVRIDKAKKIEEYLKIVETRFRLHPDEKGLMMREILNAECPSKTSITEEVCKIENHIVNKVIEVIKTDSGVRKYDTQYNAPTKRVDKDVLGGIWERVAILKERLRQPEKDAQGTITLDMAYNNKKMKAMNKEIDDQLAGAKEMLTKKSKYFSEITLKKRIRNLERKKESWADTTNLVEKFHWLAKRDKKELTYPAHRLVTNLYKIKSQSKDLLNKYYLKGEESMVEKLDMNPFKILESQIEIVKVKIETTYDTSDIKESVKRALKLTNDPVIRKNIRVRRHPGAEPTYDISKMDYKSYDKFAEAVVEGKNYSNYWTKDRRNAIRSAVKQRMQECKLRVAMKGHCEAVRVQMCDYISFQKSHDEIMSFSNALNKAYGEYMLAISNERPENDPDGLWDYRDRLAQAKFDFDGDDPVMNWFFYDDKIYSEEEFAEMFN
jgi:hypothetical protein